MIGWGQISLPWLVIEIAQRDALVLLLALMQCKEYCTEKKPVNLRIQSFF